MTYKGLNTVSVAMRIPVSLWRKFQKLCVERNCSMSDLLRGYLWVGIQATHSGDILSTLPQSGNSPDFGSWGDFEADEVLRETYKVTPEADYVKKMRAQGKEWFQIRQGLREKFELDLTGREVRALFHK